VSFVLMMMIIIIIVAAAAVNIICEAQGKHFSDTIAQLQSDCPLLQ